MSEYEKQIIGVGKSKKKPGLALLIIGEWSHEAPKATKNIFYSVFSYTVFGYSVSPKMGEEHYIQVYSDTV